MHLIGLTQHYLYTMKRNPARLLDILVWPSFEILLFSLLTRSVYNSNNTPVVIGITILSGIVFWNYFSRTIQETVSQVIDDAFSKNLQNILLTPISMFEFSISLLIAAIIKLMLSSLLLGSLIFLISPIFFYTVGIHSLMWIFSLILFGSALSFYALGLIFIVGERLSFIAWIISAIVQIFSCVIFSRDILPIGFKLISYLVPSSYVFEAIRNYLIDQTLNWNWVAPVFLLTFIYGLFGIIFFRFSLSYAQKIGRLAKL